MDERIERVARALARRQVEWNLRGEKRDHDFIARAIDHAWLDYVDQAIVSVNALDVVTPARRVEHVKRGTTYTVIGDAIAQVSKGNTSMFGPIEHRPIRPITDGDVLTVYRSEADGSLHVRFTDEFNDGRFKEL